MNNGLEPGCRGLEVDIDGNPNVPVRIKKNLKRKGSLVNVLVPGERVSGSEGEIFFGVNGKGAKIFKLV